MIRIRLFGAAWCFGLIGIAFGAFSTLPVAAQEPSTRSREAQHAIAELITRCTDDNRQYFASGLTRSQYLLFCNCYVYSALDAVDEDEGRYRREHDGEPSPGFVELSRKLVPACSEEARRRESR